MVQLTLASLLIYFMATCLNLHTMINLWLVIRNKSYITIQYMLLFEYSNQLPTNIVKDVGKSLRTTNNFKCKSKELIVTPPSSLEELILSPPRSSEDLILAPLSSTWNNLY
jgi:hypothetical protein